MIKMLYLDMFVIGFLLLGPFIDSALVSVIEFMIAPKYGRYVHEISLWGFIFKRENEDAEWERAGYKFSTTVKNKLKPKLDGDSRNIDVDGDIKSTKTTTLWNMFFCLMMFLTAIPAIVKIVEKEQLSLFQVFWLGLCCGLLFYGLMISLIIWGAIGNAKKGLKAELRKHSRALLDGVPLKDMDIKPLEMLQVSNPSVRDKIYYQYLYLMYLLDCGRMDELKMLSNRLHHELAGIQSDDNSKYILGYYWLLFYFSRYEYNPLNANHYYNIVAKDIESDKDSNARRILACYYFAIRRDKIAARRYLNEAFNNINKFSAGYETEMERRIIMELNEIFNRQGF